MDGSPSTNAYDHLMKILIIGDSGSNKRRLLGKYLNDEELTDTTTLGVTEQAIALTQFSTGCDCPSMQVWTTS